MSTNRFLTLLNGVSNLVTAIATSAGAGDANKIVATGANGRLDNSLMPSGIGATTETIPATEALSAGDLVNIHNVSGTRSVRKADSSNNRPAHGYVTAAVANAANATVFLQGLNSSVAGLSTNFGLSVWLSTAGGITTTAPANTSGTIVQLVGYVVSATSFQFEYDAPTSIA